MTISIWRYSHLLLAITASVFIFLAAVTGIILAFQPIANVFQPYKSAHFNSITLAETVHRLQQTYPDVLTLEVDNNQFVLASVITSNGASKTGYINPKTGAFIGNKPTMSPFFKWVTSLHRSLFLKGVGRFFVGFSALLLFLMVVSGFVLIIKRQGTFKHVFSKIIKENKHQYWHTVLGRLLLVPIGIMALSAVYLSAEKFNLLPAHAIKHTTSLEAVTTIAKPNVLRFSAFKNTYLSDVRYVEFPFSDAPEDYYTVALKNHEILVNQYNGRVVSKVSYPLLRFFSELSMRLHTGSGNAWWAIVLAIAAAACLVFIYTGFAITIKRRQTKLNNSFSKNACHYIILVGSENGSTVTFANMLQQKLLEANKTVFIAELNQFETFKSAKFIFIITATYGQGQAPTNATNFFKLLAQKKQPQPIQYAVLGFGSRAYPQFCQYALDVDKNMEAIGKRLLPVYTIHNKSVKAFKDWLKLVEEKISVPVQLTGSELIFIPKLTTTLEVTGKTVAINNIDNTFLIQLQPKTKTKFTSGDLLAIYPNNNYAERLYSIGKVNKQMQLSIKLHTHGLGSNFLHNLQIGANFRARLLQNPSFHFPKRPKTVIFIANGTGVAPFLGMLHSNSKQKNVHLYLGLRKTESFSIYKNMLQQYINQKKLTRLRVAFSRENPPAYVQDLLREDTNFINSTLKSGGVLMLCGSLAMQKSVYAMLTTVCFEADASLLAFYQKNGQIRADCY
ncbi:PepSY domain-containing protein [Bizionia sediminis]|uniref:PepSY domain-containing protein n=1 Tax=Bizionia sediminis TaxID=1737064 RepID=A0ABW5KUB4_9FLAO